MKKIFIDGKEGTTGLQIYQRFQNRNDIELILIDDDKRKDTAEKKKIINSVDYVFLCLPDVAAKESVALIDNDNVKVIDASTAHRTNSNWAYGFAELSSAHREKIANSKRVAVGGCYASGFISLCYPLIENNIISRDALLTCYGLSGYSGGGKSLISDYENEPEKYTSPRMYALGLTHKHLPEMQTISGLNHKPVFTPIVDDFYNGMIVNLPLHVAMLDKKMSAQELREIFINHYQSQKLVSVSNSNYEGFLDTNSLANTTKMEIFVNGHDEQIILTSRFDNLGKGASGSAIQCMNIMMGIDETTGLI